MKVSPKALAARLREQAGKVVIKAAAPGDDDILVLSGDDSDPNAPDEDAVLADASHSLVRTAEHASLLAAWQLMLSPEQRHACCCQLLNPDVI